MQAVMSFIREGEITSLKGSSIFIVPRKDVCIGEVYRFFLHFLHDFDRNYLQQINCKQLEGQNTLRIPIYLNYTPPDSHSESSIQIKRHPKHTW